MKAVRVLEYGGPLVFNDVPTPTIARDEILVKVKSTAVNHLDLVEASGTLRQILPIDLPWIPGHEFSGIVEQTGSDIAACAPGDAVFGTSGMGAYAEYLAVKPATIARKPSNLTFEEAASVPVAAQTAWQGIFTHGHLEKGQTILIHGVPALWAPLRCNWHRMPVPPSLPRQAATMRRTSAPSEPAGLSTIERRSSRKFCERRSMWFSTWSVARHKSGRSWS